MTVFNIYSTDTHDDNDDVDPVRLRREPKANLTNLHDKRLWSLAGSVEAMKLSRETQYDGVDAWTGDTVESYVMDPPEPDITKKLDIRRYSNISRNQIAQGERIAGIAPADLKYAGREIESIQSNELSTERVSNVIPHLGKHRTTSKALKPISLRADDITPGMILNEEGPHGSYGDRTYRSEYFLGGLHPSNRHTQKNKRR